MNISNIRLGFATNSSSSHSIVMLKNTAKIPVDSIYNNDDEFNFGWQNFTLSSKEMKMKYLAIQVRYSLENCVGKEMAMAVCKEIFGFEAMGTIDHQSIINLPKDIDNKLTSLDYIKELKELFNREDILVLGGNDNSDEFRLPNTEEIILVSGWQNNICRYDTRYDFFTLFNTETGAKLRFSKDFKNIIKSSSPELVDLKITNYCDKGCNFCYQNSCATAKKEISSNTYDILSALSELNVFEVAFGGGEITLIPEFWNVIFAAKEKNIIPNFSTKDLNWLSNSYAAKVLDTVGGVAFSVLKADEINKLKTSLKKNNLNTYSNKFSIQFILDNPYNNESIENICKSCNENNFSLTLLGYKRTGRATNQYEKFDSGFIKEIRKNCTRTSIDTKIAKKYEKELEEQIEDIEYLVTKKEGDFSMYIDAVEMKMGPSSFCSENEMKKLYLRNQWNRITDENILEGISIKEQILNAFSGW